MFWYQKIKAEIIDYQTDERLLAVEFLKRVSVREQELKCSHVCLEQSVVLLFKSNSIHFLIDLFALWNCGACVVPSMPKMIQSERDVLIRFISPALVIDEAGDHFSTSPECDSKISDTALILFTSGTTGDPKGVMISHQSLKNKMDVLKKHLPAEEIKNTFCALPVFFGHGLICNTLFPMMNGEKFFIVNGFNLEFIYNLENFIKEESINFFSTVPSVWDLILNFTEADPCFSSLKRVHCASSNLVFEKIKKMKVWVGNAKLFDIYGITEMLGWIGEREVLNIEQDDSSYFDRFWELQLKHENDELMVKSNYMFSGYYKRSPTEAFDNDGYFATGDVFIDGFLKSRKKEIVIKSGMKIYLSEIDSLILNSSLVEDVCSYGYFDEYTGERLGLALVLKPAVDLIDIKNFIEEKLSEYKRPDEYLVLSKLERNERGKINRDIFQRIRENG